MTIHKQLKSIIASFIALIGLVLIVFALGGIFINTLMIRQQWIDHTNDVMSEIDNAEQLFNDADYAGRNQILSGVVNDKIGESREKTLKQLDRLQQLVTDNGEQVENVDSLRTTIDSSWKVQDTQIGSVIKTDKGVFYPTEGITLRSQYMQSIDTLFQRLKVNELNLNRLDRTPRLILWQWRIIKLAGFVLTLLLIILIILFINHVKILRISIEAVAMVEDLNLKAKKGDKDLEADFDKIATYIKQEPIASYHLHKTGA